MLGHLGVCIFGSAFSIVMMECLFSSFAVQPACLCLWHRRSVKDANMLVIRAAILLLLPLRCDVTLAACYAVMHEGHADMLSCC